MSYKEAKAIVEKENKSAYADALKKNLPNDNNEGINQETIKKYEETIKSVSEKLEKLATEIEKLKKEVDKANKAKLLEKEARKRAEQEYDAMATRCASLEAKLKLYTDENKANKFLSPPRKKKDNKKMKPLEIDRNVMSSDED